MARLATVGFEGGHVLIDGLTTGGAVTYSTATKRTGGGSRALSCDSAAGNAAAYAQLSGAGMSGTGSMYVRVYFNFTSTLASGGTILAVTDSATAPGSTHPYLRLTTTGAVDFVFNNAVVGSSPALATGTWHRAELLVGLNTASGAGNETAEARINGASLGTATAASIWNAGETVYPLLGWTSTALPGASRVIFFDDCAVNDATGTSQNSWPGEGVVVHLNPSSDNARGANWTAGAGGTSNLYTCINHIPPTAVVAASATDSTQIKNAAKDTSGLYDVNIAAYTALISAARTIILTQPIAVIGNSTSTSRQLGLASASNPVVTEALGSTGGVIAATYPTGWTLLRGTTVYGDIAAASRSSGPVLRFRKNSNVTDVTMACYAAMVVEFLTLPAPRTAKTSGIAVATDRAARW